MSDHPTNPFFIGRKLEVKLLKSLEGDPDAKILVLYGRRRVGKTELLEQVFHKRNLYKFEGLEGQPDSALLPAVKKVPFSAVLSSPFLVKDGPVRCPDDFLG